MSQTWNPDELEAVLFDFGGVFTESPFHLLHSASRAADAPPERVFDIVFGPYDRDTDHPWHQLERGQKTLMEARNEILALGAQEDLETDLFQLLGKLGGSQPREAVVARTRALREAGFRTALVTNNVPEFREAWRRMIPVEELFHAIVDSSEVGVRKPDPAIYRLALEQLGVAPERALFLDDYEGNVRAAEAVGLHGLLVEADPGSALAALDRLLAR
ncbi:MAG: HAD family phosphatase [Proteobacteria bacterium]|nr:HAD family phosphatase [Pseudomonadota bacterium]